MWWYKTVDNWTEDNNSHKENRKQRFLVSLQVKIALRKHFTLITRSKAFYVNVPTLVNVHETKALLY